MNRQVKEHLEGHGVRPSVQRIAVMEYLMAHKTHPTADEIFSALQPDIPTLSRTTVYSTLSTLAACGAIRVLDLESGRMHYDGETKPHAHFVCTRCGKIHDIWPAERDWQAMMLAVPPPQGTSVTQTQLLYKGLCSQCDSKNKN
jgi:Fur family ferric uptake transcriptional regulator/Fur family peroxide stress response transcriptional regulator